MNEDIKKTPEELNQEELSAVTGGNHTKEKWTPPGNVIFSPPATDTVTNGSTNVQVCEFCRQIITGTVYSYGGINCCIACLESHNMY